MGRYILKDTPRGDKTLVYSNNREIKLHSSYDPVTESLRSVERFQKGRAGIIIVLGLGLAYHVKMLRDRFPSCSVMVIEKDMEVIDIAGEYRPEYFDRRWVINSTDDLPRFFEALDMSDFKGVSFYFHRPSYMLDKSFYDSIIKDINVYLSSKLSDLLTRFEFEEKWAENILKNLHKLASSCRVSHLYGKFSGYPGVIVSAGPSLRKNVQWLSEISSRALVVSVDTALKVLLRHGITPHIVMTLDSQKYSIKHFLGLKSHDALLLADIVSYPRILDLYGGEKIISTTSKYYNDSNGSLKRETTSIMDWVERFIQPIGDVQSGGNVASSIFDFLLNLRCDPIILVGQDLSYTGREIHCSGTYHNEGWLPEYSRFSTLDSKNQNVIRKRKIKYVESYGGKGTVISDFVFDLYKNWFADSARRVHIKVINATEGGARIKNTTEEPLESLAKSLPRPSEKPGSVLSRVLASDGDKESFNDLYKGISGALTDLEEIRKFSRENLGDEEFCNFKGLDDLLSRDNVSLLLRPYLKKIDIYLARHNFEPGKAYSLLLKEIALSSDKAVKLLTKCKENFENLR